MMARQNYSDFEEQLQTPQSADILQHFDILQHLDNDNSQNSSIISVFSLSNEHCLGTPEKQQLIESRNSSFSFPSRAISSSATTKNKINLTLDKMDLFTTKSPNNILKKEENKQEDISQFQQFEQKFKKMNKLGEGGHSVVYKVKDAQEQLFAAKIIKTSDEEIQNQIKNEFEIQQMMDHANIIKAKEMICDIKNEKFAIICELFEESTLYDLIKNQKKQFSCEEILSIIRQLVSVIEYLQQNMIVHRDITLLNILYSEKTQQIKLIDFGIAKKQSTADDDAVSPQGHPTFKNPEFTDSEDFIIESKKVDVYGLGLILASLLTSQIMTNEIRSFSLDNCQKKSPKIIELYFLSNQLICPNPKKRINIHQVSSLLKSNIILEN